MTAPTFHPLEFQERPLEEMQKRAASFYEQIRHRRTVREFSRREVPVEVIENCIRAAATAPSGANLQPWHFVLVSDPAVKKRIRAAAEEEERDFYTRRAPKEWLDALAPLGTDEHKPFLEEAPSLIVVFSRRFDRRPDGSIIKQYYVNESVGIATGMLITAVHHAGLVSLTHTPAPMSFLAKILGRPDNESPFLILVVGYPADDVQVPRIEKKPLQEILTRV
jgi:iodotyrosine deiodinase